MSELLHRCLFYWLTDKHMHAHTHTHTHTCMHTRMEILCLSMNISFWILSPDQKRVQINLIFYISNFSTIKRHIHTHTRTHTCAVWDNDSANWPLIIINWPWEHKCNSFSRDMTDDWYLSAFCWKIFFLQKLFSNKYSAKFFNYLNSLLGLVG